MAYNRQQQTVYFAVTVADGSSKSDGNIYTVNFNTGAFDNFVPEQLSTYTEANGIAISPDGGTAYLTLSSYTVPTTQGRADTVVIMYNLAAGDITGTPLIGQTVPGYVYNHLALSPDGTQLYIAQVTDFDSNAERQESGYYGSGTLIVHDLKQGTTYTESTSSSDAFVGVAISPDGLRAYVTAAGGLDTIQLSGSQTAPGNCTHTSPPASLNGGVALSADGTLAYVAADSNIVKQVLSSGVTSTVATAAGLGFGSAAYFSGIALVPGTTRAWVSYNSVPEENFDPAATLASDSHQAYIALVDLSRTNGLIAQHTVGVDYARSVAYLAASNSLLMAVTYHSAVGQSSAALLQYNLRTNTSTLISHQGAGSNNYLEAAGVVLSADGSNVYWTIDSYGSQPPAGYPEAGVYVYNFARNSFTLVAQSSDIDIVYNALALSPDGNTLYVVAGDGVDDNGDHTGYDGSGVLYCVGLKQPVPSLQQLVSYSAPLVGVAVSANGQTLYATSSDGLLNADISKLPAACQVPGYSGVALSADGSTAYVLSDSTISAIKLSNSAVSTVSTASSLGLGAVYFSGIALVPGTTRAYVTYNSVPAISFNPETTTSTQAYVALVDLSRSNGLVAKYGLGVEFADNVVYQASSNSLFVAVTYSGGTQQSSAALLQYNLRTNTSQLPAHVGAGTNAYLEASGVAPSADGSKVYFTIDSFGAQALANYDESAIYLYDVVSNHHSIVAQTSDINIVYNALALSVDGNTLFVATGYGVDSNGDHTGYDGQGALYCVGLQQPTPTLQLLVTGGTAFVGVAVSANGQTAYVTSGTQLFPINIAALPQTCLAPTPFDALAVSADGTTAYVLAGPTLYSINVHSSTISTTATSLGLGFGTAYFSGIGLVPGTTRAWVTFNSVPAASFNPENSTSQYIYVALIDLSQTNRLIESGYFAEKFVKGVAFDPAKNALLMAVTYSSQAQTTGAALLQYNVSATQGGFFDVYVTAEKNTYLEGGGVALSADNSKVYFIFNSYGDTVPAGYYESAIYVYDFSSGYRNTIVAQTSDVDIVYNALALSKDGNTLWVAAGDGVDSNGDHTGYSGSGVLYCIRLNQPSATLQPFVTFASSALLGVALSADGQTAYLTAVTVENQLLYVNISAGCPTSTVTPPKHSSSSSSSSGSRRSSSSSSSSSTSTAAAVRRSSSSTSAPTSAASPKRSSSSSSSSTAATTVKRSSSSTSAPTSAAAVKRSSSSSSAPAAAIKHSSSSTSASSGDVSSPTPAPATTALTVCSYTIAFGEGEAGTTSETITGYLSYNPAQPVSNTPYPAYPPAYLLQSLNGTRVVKFSSYNLTSSIIALSSVTKPGTVQTSLGQTYTNLIYPASAVHIDNAGWQFSQTNSTQQLSYVKLAAGANNATAAGNLLDQSLTYPPAGHTTRGINGAFTQLACRNVTQH